MSALELQRQANILRNQEMLQSMGLDSLKSDVAAPAAAAKAARIKARGLKKAK
jgi:hypothetical protein